jgi:hypothetical protein
MTFRHRHNKDKDFFYEHIVTIWIADTLDAVSQIQYIFQNRLFYSDKYFEFFHPYFCHYQLPPASLVNA